jgi:PAS domain S-box-containing protein
MWLFDGTDTRYVNRAMAELTGYTAEELLQPGFFAELIHADDRDLVLDRGRARLRGEDVPERYDIRIVSKDGEVKTLALHARALQLAGRPVSVVSAMDVTPLRQAEKTIQDGTARVVDILRTLPVHLIATTPEGKPTFVNEHWLTLTGQTTEEALAHGTAPLIHPEDRRAATAAWRAALKSREGYNIEYRVRDKDGMFRWQSFRIRPNIGDGNALLGWLGAGVDIHDSKALQVALEELNEHQADLIRAKDEVLGLISHELRSPLTTLSGNAHVLHSRGATLDSATRQAIAEDMVRDAQRMTSVMENMLVLSRMGLDSELELEPARLPRLAEQCVNDFCSRAPERPVTLEYEPGLPLAEANAGYYQQILGNLLSNAHKYSPPGGGIHVCLREQGGMLQTTVTDAGPGIPAGEIDRVFDPFYRAAGSSSASGIGLGLTVCQRLAELHGGRISVRNLPGGGCEFSFTTRAAATEATI